MGPIAGVQTFPEERKLGFYKDFDSGSGKTGEVSVWNGGTQCCGGSVVTCCLPGSCLLEFSLL